MVKADTLITFLSSFRAVLSQQESNPYTEKDVKLRERILDLYPRNMPSPFPWLFT
jgi:hypothetical protein